MPESVASPPSPRLRRRRPHAVVLCTAIPRPPRHRSLPCARTEVRAQRAARAPLRRALSCPIRTSIALRCYHSSRPLRHVHLPSRLHRDRACPVARRTLRASRRWRGASTRRARPATTSHSAATPTTQPPSLPIHPHISHWYSGLGRIFGVASQNHDQLSQAMLGEHSMFALHIRTARTLLHPTSVTYIQ